MPRTSYSAPPMSASKKAVPSSWLSAKTPLHPGHLRLMSQAVEAGAVIFPPIPAFYHHPKSIDDLINATVGRMLARIGIANDLVQPWNG